MDTDTQVVAKHVYYQHIVLGPCASWSGAHRRSIRKMLQISVDLSVDYVRSEDSPPRSTNYMDSEAGRPGGQVGIKKALALETPDLLLLITAIIMNHYVFIKHTYYSLLIIVNFLLLITMPCRIARAPSFAFTIHYQCRDLLPYSLLNLRKFPKA